MPGRPKHSMCMIVLPLQERAREGVCVAAGQQSAAGTHDGGAPTIARGDTSLQVTGPTRGTGVLGAEMTPLLQVPGADGVLVGACVSALHNGVTKVAIEATARSPNERFFRRVPRAAGGAAAPVLAGDA